MPAWGGLLLGRLQRLPRVMTACPTIEQKALLTSKPWEPAAASSLAALSALRASSAADSAASHRSRSRASDDCDAAAAASASCTLRRSSVTCATHGETFTTVSTEAQAYSSAQRS